jgi:pimeloyl-ACP methyl ester carboxylesterase
MTQLAIANEDVVTLETAPTHYVEGHGIRFAYRRLGPSTGTPLILLQHFSGNIDAWDPAVVNALAADRPVIAFDNAGVGLSTGQTPDNVATMARDAVDFINVLGLSEVDLLGFSLGGCVAQQIAAEHGRLVRKLILVGTAPKGGEEHKRRRGTSASDSAGRVFANRRAGSPFAAILYEIVRQPVGRPGIPEAGKGPYGRSGHRKWQRRDRSAGQGGDHLVCHA